MRQSTPVVLICAVLLFVGAFSEAHAQESTNFKMERITIAASAGPVSSVNFSTAVTFAQEGPAGSISRCNDSFLQSTGFWSLLGETPVSVFLLADKNDVEPTSVDLLWSGSSSEFTVYRSIILDAVVDPLNEIVNTSMCATTDAPPPASIVFYLVQPTGN